MPKEQVSVRVSPMPRTMRGRWPRRCLYDEESGVRGCERVCTRSCTGMCFRPLALGLSLVVNHNVTDAIAFAKRPLDIALP